MRSSKEIQADIDTLQAELAEAKEYELGVARAEIQRIMERAGLTIEDVIRTTSAPARSKPAKQNKGILPARYRFNGEEWSGMGRKPGWAIELGDQLEKHRVAN